MKKRKIFSGVYNKPKVTSDRPDRNPILKAEIRNNFPIPLYLGGKSATPIPAAAPDDDCEYDVFISYQPKEPDRSWVRKTLLPYLESKGLRVYLDLRFPLGVPTINSIEKAVRQSRYTLMERLIYQLKQPPNPD